MFAAAATNDAGDRRPNGDGPALLALVEAARDAVPRLPEIVEAAGSATAIIEGRARLRPRDAQVARALAARVTPDALEDWGRVLAETLDRSPGTRLLTITDPGYPVNLRAARHRPAFVFVRGDLRAGDERAVAVVGSRQASADGLELAAELSARLAAGGTTIVSGLAAGIDAAAHCGALEVGGRTIASIGTGVDRVYPREHGPLAEAVAGSGALISRSWPDAPPTRRGFRLRNAVTSGLALATVVIEAGPASGARMQARLALEQHRPLVLSPLLARQDWARRLAERADVVMAADLDEMLEALADLPAPGPAAQLSLF